MFEMIQDLLDHRRAFNTGDDLHRATAQIAGLDVDLEHAFQALSPSHRRVTLGCRLVLILSRAPAAFGWSHLLAQAAVWGKYAMGSGGIRPKADA